MHSIQPLIVRSGNNTLFFGPHWYVKTEFFRFSQMALGLLGAAAVCFEIHHLASAKKISEVSLQRFSPVVYQVARKALVFSMTSLGLSHLFCSPNKKIMPSVQLVSVDEVNQRNLGSYVHELCEIDQEGSLQSCPLERMKAIIEQLKEQNALDILNSIPEYKIKNQQPWSEQYPRRDLLTPLQYWAAKGDLEAVKFLIQQGAVDYCDSDDYWTTSALYEAAIERHSNVVDFLLQQGASAATLFNKNVLYSFIPKFIFHSCHPDNLKNLGCLEKILSDLKEYDPKNLEQQLKIPVDKQANNLEENSLGYLCRIKPEYYEQAQRLLEKFGARARDTLSVNDLKIAGLPLRSGRTLGEIAQRMPQI